MSQRYSDEAMAKKRAKHRQIFLDHAKSKYGDRFDYSRMEFVAQKIEVTIGCPDHGWIPIKPDKHLRNKMGCQKCGRAHGSKNKEETARKMFLKKFEKRHAGRLKLVTDYQGSKSYITVECINEGHQFETTPSNLIYFFEEGCAVCAREERRRKQMTSQEDFVQKARDKFPNLDFGKTQYQGSGKSISFICPEHGEQSCRAADLFRSYYGCPACGNEQVGYAGYRIRRLMSGDPLVTSRPTRIALMKMNIWGIETYKLGVTTRTLEARYKEALDTVYYETVLDELDALMLEHLLHTKYKDDQDLRVKKKGMRDGERWSGDEELYFKHSLKSILADLKYHVQALSENDSNYWQRFPDLELPSAKTRKSTFAKYLNKNRPVICLETKTIYPSAGEAARKLKTSQGNLSMVCRGLRGDVKGLRFAFLDDYESGNVPVFVPSKRNRRQVRCIDTGEVFASLMEGAKSKGINSSKITSVCKGKRKTTGGLRWEYVDKE